MTTKTRARQPKVVSFKATKEEYGLIGQVVVRAVALGRLNGRRIDQLSLTMDLTACHANGCPLRLADLLAADDANFGHDVFGISRHINRDTGELGGHFLPRFARKAGK